MKKANTRWSNLSLLMALALVLMYWTPISQAADKQTKPMGAKQGGREVPKYGGIITVVRSDEPRDFDEAYSNTWTCYTLSLTNDNLVLEDWSKGPSGTNEYPLLTKSHLYPSLTEGLKGHLCESWEFPDPVTHVYHIRKGIRFHNKPPVNGREMTAEDVGYSVKRVFDMPGGWLYASAVKPKSYEYPDKYTLVLKFDEFEAYMIMRTAGITYTVPREVVEMNNGEGLRNWRNACGTGPFVLRDYVPGNAIYFERNPDYWEKDPFFPENQLPYVDQLKILLIPDLSTQIAALRSGKIDRLTHITWEQRESLLTTNRELKETPTLGNGLYFGMRIDAPPFDNVKVRRALSMAIDRDLILRDFYHGFADLIAYPIPPESGAQHTPFEELPDSVKEVLSYNPEKARQLLSEAGYPKGFKMEVNCLVGEADLVALCASMWQMIGVEANIKVREVAVRTSLYYGKSYKDMLTLTSRGGFGEAFLEHYETGTTHNFSMVSDPWYDKRHREMMRTVDPDARSKLCKELNLYILDNVYRLITPAGHQWSLWQPWLKQYNGEISLGYCHWFKPLVYSWVDEDLKKSVTGKR